MLRSLVGSEMCIRDRVMALEMEIKGRDKMLQEAGQAESGIKDTKISELNRTISELEARAAQTETAAEVAEGMHAEALASLKQESEAKEAEMKEQLKALEAQGQLKESDVDLDELRLRLEASEASVRAWQQESDQMRSKFEEAENARSREDASLEQQLAKLQQEIALLESRGAEPAVLTIHTSHESQPAVQSLSPESIPAPPESSDPEPMAEEPIARKEGSGASHDPTIWIGFRQILSENEFQLWKVQFTQIGPEIKCKHLTDRVNNEAGFDITIDALVPLWTPYWDTFSGEDLFSESLRNSVDLNDRPFDEAPRDPIRLVGVPEGEFDEDFWNHHTNFNSDEWKLLELKEND
eukprot:TRINITY_DN43346_c0_g1_i1.p1 TRINITY_DN43346_c0_g1~~TRINITY_DN43346_c0_g1_i1.p1  ORF type:complete len:353 (-),score=92.68 TRINITY_DN43346_c0_g1_i1:240-1298(-)